MSAHAFPVVSNLVQTIRFENKCVIILYIFYFQDFEIDNIDELCDKLKQLSTESHKYRAKRDRRQQKSSFRDILRAVQVMGLVQLSLINP